MGVRHARTMSAETQRIGATAAEGRHLSAGANEGRFGDAFEVDVGNEGEGFMVTEAVREELQPVIGVVPKYLADTGYVSVDDHYVQAVIAAGGIPFVLPLTDDTHVYETLLPMLDGILLTGGKDIDPERYGEHGVDHAKLYEPVPVREQVECYLLNYALCFDVPLFGVCRGMQFINVFLGGTLYVDLPEQFRGIDEDGQPRTEPWRHWQDVDYSLPSHWVSIVPGSRLDEILGVEKLHTNSMHHQGVRKLAPGLDVTACGPDGLVEGVCLPTRTFLMGVQWHPEFFAGEKSMGPLFEALVEAARAFRPRKVELGITRETLRLTSEEKGGPWPEVSFEVVG